MRARKTLAAALAGGDRRSIGNANSIAERLRDAPRLVGAAVLLLTDADPVVSMRAADALEKASAGAPAILAPHRARLLQAMATARQQEVIWHLAQMLPRLDLAGTQAGLVARWLERVFAGSDSRIARANALEGLIELAARYPVIRPDAWRVLAVAAKSPLPAVAARARKLARRLPKPV